MNHENIINVLEGALVFACEKLIFQGSQSSNEYTYIHVCAVSIQCRGGGKTQDYILWYAHTKKQTEDEAERKLKNRELKNFDKRILY